MPPVRSVVFRDHELHVLGYRGVTRLLLAVLALALAASPARAQVGPPGGLAWADGAGLQVGPPGVAGQAAISGGQQAPWWFAPPLGSVIFAGPNGQLSSDSSFFWDTYLKRFGLGTNTPQAQFHLVKDQASTVLLMTTYGPFNAAIPTITGQHAGGTLAAPLASPINSVLLRMNGQGHTGVSFIGQARSEIRTAEAWGAGRGTYHALMATPIGGTVVADTLRIGPQSGARISLVNPVGVTIPEMVGFDVPDIVNAGAVSGTTTGVRVGLVTSGVQNGPRYSFEARDFAAENLFRGVNHAFAFSGGSESRVYLGNVPQFGTELHALRHQLTVRTDSVTNYGGTSMIGVFSNPNASTPLKALFELGAEGHYDANGVFSSGTHFYLWNDLTKRGAWSYNFINELFTVNAASGLAFQNALKVQLNYPGKAMVLTNTPYVATGPGWVVESNGTIAFTVSTGSASTQVILTMPPGATTGWNCHVENRTALQAYRPDQRVVVLSSAPTSLTLESQRVSTGQPLPFVFNDLLAAVCVAY